MPAQVHDIVLSSGPTVGLVVGNIDRNKILLTEFGKK